ncbi:MAG: heme-binding protein [Clostridia bacterium]|nr:heme-binding protein [Clostridia bacterium]
MDEAIIKQIVQAAMNESAPKMTLSLAKKLANAVEDKAREMGLNIVVSISDAAARPVLTECMDDAYIASYDVAFNKAYTVVALKMPTITLKGLSQPGESLYGIQFTNGGKIVIFGGGDPLKIGDKIVGGLGVSGGTEEQDTFLSAYGAEYFRKLTE